MQKSKLPGLSRSLFFNTYTRLDQSVPLARHCLVPTAGASPSSASEISAPITCQGAASRQLTHTHTASTTGRDGWRKSLPAQLSWGHSVLDVFPLPTGSLWGRPHKSTQKKHRAGKVDKQHSQSQPGPERDAQGFSGPDVTCARRWVPWNPPCRETARYVLELKARATWGWAGVTSSKHHLPPRSIGGGSRNPGAI